MHHQGLKKTLFAKTLITLGVCTALTACQPATTQQSTKSPSSIDAALQRAANSAASSEYSLSYLEKLYKRNSEDPVAAANYARALRENNYLNRATLVLAPFANIPSSPAIAKREYAAILLAKGQYKEAEEYAQQAILKDSNDFKAYHYLGIALDAQGMHKKAERAFRKGLDNWQGDPTSIMNNLALNLTSQEYIDEAVEILRKAKTIAPNKIEVERNLRIVIALQQSQTPPPPKPKIKPESIVLQAEKTKTDNEEPSKPDRADMDVGPLND